MKNKISDRQNMKKPPQKVAYFFFNCPTAQMAEFMFPNVTYRATVYRTGDVILEWSLTLFESIELTLVRRGLAGILENTEFLVPCSA